MILVVGGTGVLGSAIARRLLDERRRVRVMTRVPERARALADRGAEVVVADLRDLTSLDRAFEGTTHVVTTANSFLGAGADSVVAIDEHGNRNLIKAARRARVRQFVFTSVLLPDIARTIDFFAAKFQIADELRRSGLPYTILRPAAFMETWAHLIGAPLIKTGKTTIFGSGENPINFVAVDDVATVAVMTIDRADALNADVDIIGPENLTLLQIAEVFERVTGKSGRRLHIPVRVLRVVAAVGGLFNPVLARKVKAGMMMATVPQSYDPAAMLKQYPIALTRLEDWVRARYAAGGV
jgi:NADH dehydrogenase